MTSATAPTSLLRVCLWLWIRHRQITAYNLENVQLTQKLIEYLEKYEQSTVGYILYTPTFHPLFNLFSFLVCPTDMYFIFNI